MRITVNNESVKTGAAHAEALVREVLGDVPEAGTALAIDGEVIPRSAWATTQVREGAAVDILTAVQGG